MFRKKYNIEWTQRKQYDGDNAFETCSTTVSAHIIEDAIQCLRATQPDIYEIVSCKLDSIVPISDADMISVKN